jgi:biofilm PGA synthesis N-glycosyltransferase PgaC
MLITDVFFWVSFSVLFFCYFGYGLLLFLFNEIKRIAGSRKKEGHVEEWIPVTIIIPAFNEALLLDQKIKNTLSIDYPADKLKIIFVTDGSTDGSAAIIKKYPSIIWLHQAERKGKLAAIKRAMLEAKTPVVVFSDANAILNRECIQKIAVHYNDPATGGVAGEKKIINDEHSSAVGEAEGIYWNYESFMKKQDAAFNTVVGAAGELFSIRTELFPILNDNIILDDFIISMKICLQGYKIKYEPGAFATEFPSASLAEEKKRKIRISAGAYQSIGYLKGALNFFKYPLLSFQYISRRLLRWIFCPLMLVILLLASILLVTAASHNFYLIFLFMQLFFYVAAFAGWLIIRSGKRAGILTIPFYFVFMNYCLVKGFIKFMKGKQTVLWEKSIRQAGE